MNISKFGLQNFRVFKEYFEFELAPITILTGPNNSGKSSLVKALLLLHENEKNINHDLHWDTPLNYFTGQHDLGNHQYTKNLKEEHTYFSFTFFQEYKFVIGIKPDGYFDWDYIIWDENNEFVMAQSGGYIKFDVSQLIRFFKNRLADGLSKENISNDEATIDFKLIEKLIIDLSAFEEKFWLVDIDVVGDYHYQINSKFQPYDEKTRKEILKSLDEGIFTTINYEDNNDLSSSDVEDFLQEALIYLFARITKVELSNNEISFLIPTSINEYSNSMNFFKFPGLFYVGALREPLRRTYSNTDKSVFQSFVYDTIVGSHFAMLSKPKNSESINRNEKDKEYEKHYTFIKKWLKEFDIGKEISYGYNSEQDLFYLTIDGKALPENGFGFSSILHLLLALEKEQLRLRTFANDENILGEYWQSIKNREDLPLSFPATIIIEEPETGLHPVFQSKMAEMLVDIQRTYDVNLIVETHSEYIIRKLQYLTATEKINPEDVAIYYFNNPKKIPKEEDQIKKITIAKNGSLSDNFGTGFIDEATNMKFELLRFMKNQQN